MSAENLVAAPASAAPPNNDEEAPPSAAIPSSNAPAPNGHAPPRGGGGDDLPLYCEPSADVDARALDDLRRFHYGLVGPPADEHSWWPAAMWRYRDAARVRSDYPLVLHCLEDEAVASPLSSFLEDATTTLQQRGREPSILRDNLVRLERIARRPGERVERPAPARAALKRHTRALLEELRLGEANASRLDGDLDALLQLVPDGALLAGQRRDSDLDLLLHAARAHLGGARWRLRQELEGLCARLSALLDADRRKRPEARAASAVERSLAGPSAFDAAALSKVIGRHRGSEAMQEARRVRIQGALETLTAFLEKRWPLLVLVVREGELVSLAGDEDVEVREASDPVEGAACCFDVVAASFADAFKARRVARLELREPGGAYDPGRHDPWLSRFDWQAFAKDELLLLPTIAPVVDADGLARASLAALSRLILSGRRVQVLARVCPLRRPGVEEPEEVVSARLELGAFAMSHREALVVQSSASRPVHFLAGLARAMSATRPSVLLSTACSGREAPFVEDGALIDSRAHPLFVSDPGAGQSLARSFDISDNEEVEADWPSLVLHAKGGEAGGVELPAVFSFADAALLEPALRDCFTRVPEGCRGSVDLVRADRYLELDDDEAAQRIPFVWAVDDEGRLRELAFTRALAFAARDRLRTWRAWQELAGVHNEHVERAVARAIEDVEARARRERERLGAEHAEELEAMRREAAAEVMQRLAAGLMQLDVAALGAGAAAANVAARSPAPPVPADEAPSPSSDPEVDEPPPADELSFDDPFVDSALCTSCHDCVTINPLLFVYDENKQIRIGDPRAGTFAELVEAAKLCPAKCIHPGKPLNLKEPNLERLLAEAEPFQ